MSIVEAIVPSEHLHKKSRTVNSLSLWTQLFLSVASSEGHAYASSRKAEAAGSLVVSRAAQPVRKSCGYQLDPLQSPDAEATISHVGHRSKAVVLCVL